MSSAFIVPFNQQPFSVAVKTGSYTIPAGYYARAIVNLEGSATFTIDAVTAIRGTQSNSLGSSPLSAFQRTVIVDGGGGTSTRWALLADGAPPSSGNPDSADSDAFVTSVNQKTTIAEIRLPTGTVINGTGTWRAVVELYPMIS